MSEHYQRDMAIPADEAADLRVIQTHVFGGFKVFFNGLITNDKFCMSRTARLKLSHWRLPRSARQPSSQGVQSPVEEHVREYLPQQRPMKKRQWNVRRSYLEQPDARSRWDRSYQSLIQWSGAGLERPCLKSAAHSGE